MSATVNFFHRFWSRDLGICRVPRLVKPGSIFTRRLAIFTSSHFRVDSAIVTTYLDRRGLAYRDTPTHLVVRICPLCSKPHNNEPTNLFKLYIRKQDGAFFCHRCGIGGSFFDFKKSQGDIPQLLDARGVDVATPGDIYIDKSSSGPQVTTIDAPSSNIIGAASKINTSVSADMKFVGGACDDLLLRGCFPAVLQYLHSRGFSDDVLQQYRVGAARRWFAYTDGRAGGEEHDVVVFPWLAPIAVHESAGGDLPDSALRCVRLKIRSISDKSCQQMLPKGGSSAGLFGLHLLPRQQDQPSSPLLLPPLPPPLVAPKRKGAKPASLSLPVTDTAPLQSTSSALDAASLHIPALEPPFTVHSPIVQVVITEGEFDALAVRQATGYAAVSLPNGCRSLPLEVLPLLENFERLHLWLDDDIPGREGAERISDKLGFGRCFIVNPSPILLRKVEPAGVISGVTSPKDANEALLFGYDLSRIIAGATVRRHEQIISFDEFRPAVMREVAAALGSSAMMANGVGGSAGGRWPHSGAPLRSLPRINRLLKGFRAGELTIVTGKRTTLQATIHTHTYSTHQMPCQINRKRENNVLLNSLF